MKRFLAVGINHFMKPGNDLAGCVADAHTMQTIAKSLGIDADILLDQYAIKRNVMRWLAQAVGDAKDGKISYIGFSWSGHGTHYTRPQEPDGLGEAVCCYDIVAKGNDWDPATIITDSEISTLLNQVPSTCMVEVWADTCYSGGWDRAIGAYGETSPKYIHNPGNEAGLTRVSSSAIASGLNSNIVMWQACSEAQTSEDAFINGGPHGAFTYYWNRSFRSNMRASRVEVLVKTRAGLSANKYEQFPRLKAWNKEAQEKVGQ